MGFGKRLEAGTLKRIHVNRAVIARNKKMGTNNPVFRIKVAGKSIPAREVRTSTSLIRFVQAGERDHFGRVIKPLSCGAVAWIETRGELYYWA